MATIKEWWVLGHKIQPIEVTGDFDMVKGETPPNVPGPPPHYHKALSEVFVVLEGEMEFVVDGVPKILKVGDAIDLPPNALHTFRNSSDKPCQWLNIHSPKGFLSFFESMGVDVEAADAFEQSVDEKVIQRVMNEAAQFDMHIKL